MEADLPGPVVNGARPGRDRDTARPSALGLRCEPVLPGPLTYAPPVERELADLRSTVETLAAIERRATSPGEREAAEWIARRLGELGCAARVEEERAFDAWAPTFARLSAIGAAAGAVALARRRGSRIAAALAGLTGAAIADDISNGPRLARRATLSERPTWNVV